MLIGYARVSTQDQTLDLQTDALSQAGCEKIFKDTASGAKAEQSGLQEALNHLRAGDTLVVWRLDQLGRSLQHLIVTITAVKSQGIGFKSLQEHMDTTTSGGKLIFHIFGALAEFEREVIRERTNAGLQELPEPVGRSAAGRRFRRLIPRKSRSPKSSTPIEASRCRRLSPHSKSAEARCIGTYGAKPAPQCISTSGRYLSAIVLDCLYEWQGL